MATKPPFRISVINYLNATPLNYGLRHDLSSKGIQLHFHIPSLCANYLKHNKVDAGLISSIEYLKIPNLEIVPKHCIASLNKVRSVIILAKNAPNKIQTLAIDASSRTSTALSQIILREIYNVYPKVITMMPNQTNMLNYCDAAMLIGDAAMQANRNGLYVIDLAEEWYRWTGLPFVFALWAVRKGVADLVRPLNVTDLFSKSLAIGKQNLATIIEEAKPKIGWTEAELRHYLTKNILYDLGQAEQSGLNLFYNKALQHGFVDAIKPLYFL
jgi:chorismate dehydratase